MNVDSEIRGHNGSEYLPSRVNSSDDQEVRDGKHSDC